MNPAKKDNEEKPAAVSIGQVLTYSLPTVGYGFMIVLFISYYLKFATDVLMLSPALIGLAFGLARIWDAITDPVAGYLSDRTTHRLGRRRPWLLFSAPAMGLTFYFAFSPPLDLTGRELELWAIVSIFAFYTAITTFMVPHMSLGAELTSDGPTRNRIFGLRYGAALIGSSIGLWVISRLMAAEESGASLARAEAARMSLVAGFAMTVMVVYAVVRLKERREFVGRGGHQILSSFSDVLANIHARKILFVTFVEYMALSMTSVMVLYVAEYVIGAPEYGALFFFVWMVFAMLGIPIWLRLARRFPKRNLWIFALLLSAVSYGSLIFLQAGNVEFMMAVMVITGFAAACGGTVSLSTQSDIIDFDEFKTGERKEGTYFACWNLVVKFAGGMAILLAGATLEWSGFIPKTEQTALVMTSMVTYLSIFPFLIYCAGAFVLSRYSFTELAHREVCRQLKTRRDAGANSQPAHH